MEDEIKRILNESADIKRKVAQDSAAKIEQIARAVIASYKKGGKLILFGNGGSAADAQHIEAELVHRFEKDRKCILALALTTNTSVLTAIGNDWGFERVFERQVEGLVNNRDVVIGITTSGNSLNVIKGVEQAKKNGAITIALTGKDGGKIKNIADICLIIPSNVTARIQEAHITILHIVCGLIEKELFGK